MLKLYHSPRTRSVRIVWLLEELQLPYELEVVPLLGKEFSGADIMMGYTLRVAQGFGVLDERYPNTTAYLGRLESGDGFQKALAT